MTLTSIFSNWLTAAKNAVLPVMGLPKVGWILIVSVIASGGLKILLEWQLRLTLVAIFRHAPDGSVVVIQKRGMRGSVWVQVGNGPVPGTHPGHVELQ